jgi:O-methyltransferase
MLARAVGVVGSVRKELHFRKIFRKFREFTMVPENTYIANLHLAAQVRRVPGDIVECGTWRGGMIAGIADVLGADRHYRLFDSFEGLPLAKEIDGEAALAWQRDTSGPNYFNNCRASEDEAKRAMSLSAGKRYTIVKGWFNQTLSTVGAGPIALLRMDADWYESTKEILDNLGHCVVPGGLIIVDDYYSFEGCTRAVNEFAAARAWMIRQDPRGGICFIVPQSLRST